jgi:hypothetical protein
LHSNEFSHQIYPLLFGFDNKLWNKENKEIYSSEKYVTHIENIIWTEHGFGLRESPI